MNVVAPGHMRTGFPCKLAALFALLCMPNSLTFVPISEAPKLAISCSVDEYLNILNRTARFSEQLPNNILICYIFN
jgi:hypothetical protein